MRWRPLIRASFDSDDFKFWLLLVLLLAAFWLDKIR